ncbi:MAG: glutathione-dependent disulfide-bond oxidoreductase [Acidobacteriota bacterium]|nr:glutathione-dependent disulfide-bond oxidoreductase [Acidobacteriota bacterium]
MREESVYKPPKVWKWEQGDSGSFSNSFNRPTAGATHEKKLPAGKHTFQVYSMATPNGIKIAIMFEELLTLGHTGAEYDAYMIKIGEGDQFGSDFVGINPNSKIPAMIDNSTSPPLRLFESGSMLLYLADKFNALIPVDPAKRAECLNWVFWQVGSAPYVGGGFGHFYAYAPVKMKYPIDRFTTEVKRQLDVLDRHLADKNFICGDEYTIADIMIWPWYGQLVLNILYEAAEFLDTALYKNVNRWAQHISSRDAVKRGRMVNRAWGPLDGQLHERHDAGDFQAKTQDKIG